MAFETPESALYEMTDATVDGVPISIPRLSWRGDKLRFGRPLAVTYTFSDRGGYVALARHYQRHLKRFPFNGRFLDCIGTCPFWEGEDWDSRHPLDALGTRQARQELLQMANRCGLVVGTEGGIDCYLPNLHWLETPMSMVRWTVGSMPLPGWQPVTLKPDYELNIATTHRIPFYSLVHHAEIVSTWRWEDGFPRVPQYWQDKNLWSVLNGGVPMYFLDREHLEKWRPQIAQTHRYVCDWVRKVAFAEMIDHRFISPDRQVQETVFTGDIGVVVNFGKEPYRLPDGQTVPGRSYRTFTNGTVRKYSPPPVAEMSY
jgi:hypothetical protein